VLTKLATFGISSITLYYPLAINSNKVTGVAAPTVSADAATKGYVDGVVPVLKVVTGTMDASGTETMILTRLTTKHQ